MFIRTARIGLAGALLAFAGTAAAEGLGGSPASMVHQHSVAVSEKYAFLRTPLEVARLAKDGQLVLVTPDSDLVLAGVSFPYARPEVLALVRRIARDYRDSTGKSLTVTSLTRPAALQPRNAHKLSVHPAGMAVDFRVPNTPAERAWLERTLLGLEKAGMLDVTREKTPAHYHVAVFAEPTLAWVSRRNAADAEVARLNAARAATVAAPRDLARVPSRLRIDSVDESRLPMFAAAMMALLAMAVGLLQRGGVARTRR